jgi:hypothetical protein
MRRQKTFSPNKDIGTQKPLSSMERPSAPGVSAGGSGADEKQILADFAFVLSSFLPKNRTKVQENHNVFNERLPDS